MDEQYNHIEFEAPTSLVYYKSKARGETATHPDQSLNAFSNDSTLSHICNRIISTETSELSQIKLWNVLETFAALHNHDQQK